METGSKSSGFSYRQILTSTAVVAGASLVNIVSRIVRTKVLAVVVGPPGVGLLGVLNSIVDMIGAMAGLGIDSSGVRQVSESAGGHDEEKVARTIWTVRATAVCLGLFGMIVVIGLSGLIGRVTFENNYYTSEIVLLSVVVLLGVVTDGEGSLILGTRRIGDFAKVNVISGWSGTLLSVPIIYFWGQKGIVPSLIAVAASGLVSTRWYTRRIKVVEVRMSWTDVCAELGPLLRLGGAIMLSMLMAKSVTYIVNVVVARRLNLEAVGLYQVAVVLSSIYVGFILNAMVKDYLPQLTRVAGDHAACNRLVNEQIEIGILLSVPGILATLAFAPVIIRICYSSAFVPAFNVLRWQILGILLQVVSWPMFFILEAKGRGKLYLLTSVGASVAYVVLMWVGISIFGLVGTGMASVGRWAVHAIAVYMVVKNVTGFAWSRAVSRIVSVTFPAVALVFVSSLVLDEVWTMTVGGGVAVASALYSLRCLAGVVRPGRLFVHTSP